MATTFLHALGSTGWSTGSGYIAAPLNVMASEISGLANASSTVSTSVFNQTNFGQAQRAYVWLTVVTASSIVTSGGNLSGWWVHGANSTTLLEAQNATQAPSRPPDFIIPLMINTAFVGSTYFATGVPFLPYDNFKVLIQNNSGATLGVGNHTITVAPVGDQY